MRFQGVDLTYAFAGVYTQDHHHHWPFDPSAIRHLCGQRKSTLSSSNQQAAFEYHRAFFSSKYLVFAMNFDAMALVCAAKIISVFLRKHEDLPANLQHLYRAQREFTSPLLPYLYKNILRLRLPAILRFLRSEDCHCWRR